MPLVSVIIPTYNRTDLLSRAVESVLAQTFEDFELVVVDDGSTEDVESVVDGYDDDRLRYVAHETNHGANVARNTGIDVAAGEYVAFLDSDDEWRPGKLAAQVGRLESESEPESGSESEEWVAAYCDYDVVVPGLTGKLVQLGARLLGSGASERHEGGEELVADVLADDLQTGAGSTLLVRTDVARDVGGFDPRLDWFQDPEFLIRVLKAGKLAHVTESLVIRHYSGTPDVDTIRRTDEQFLGKFADDVDRYESLGYDIAGTHRFLLAKYSFQAGRFGDGVRYLAGATVAPRQVPGLVWYAGRGVRRRKRALASMAALTLLVVLFSGLSTGSASD
ncbi:MAG: glycosyltransferase family 2 protein [Salinigranum sp.]